MSISNICRVLGHFWLMIFLFITDHIFYLFAYLVTFDWISDVNSTSLFEGCAYIPEVFWNFVHILSSVTWKLALSGLLLRFVKQDGSCPQARAQSSLLRQHPSLYSIQFLRELWSFFSLAIGKRGTFPALCEHWILLTVIILVLLFPALSNFLTSKEMIIIQLDTPGGPSVDVCWPPSL